MLPVQPVGQRCAEWSGQLQVGECCLCRWLARVVQRGLVDYRRVNAACVASWPDMHREVSRLHASECCLCSQLAGDAQRGSVNCRHVNVACAAGWPEMCSRVLLLLSVMFTSF